MVDVEPAPGTEARPTRSVPVSSLGRDGSEERPIVLITGAARGLGAEVARQLADRGATVVVTARQPELAADVAAAIERSVALPVGLDVTHAESVANARAAFEADHDRLDVLINNAAAYGEDAPVLAPDVDAAHVAIETNLFGAWRMITSFLPLLERSPHPRIVNVSSGAGSHDDPVYGLKAQAGAAAAYGISKAALNALTSLLAAELAGSLVIVNAVCPGLTATWPGAEKMGARPVADGAAGIVWAATLPDNGPRGGFFRDGAPLPW